MQEQTKVFILLCIVIIIAVSSLIFVFYQYAKIQSQVKQQFTPRIIDQTILKIEETPINYQPKQTCKQPNCTYEGKYYNGVTLVETENKDVNEKNIRGCHKQGKELTVISTGKNCFIQTIKCTAGGWTLASPSQQC